MATQADNQPIEFRTHPDRYKHWQLQLDGEQARLLMKVDETHPLREGYSLKLNSYDLSVDIELADAVERLRFSHPEVKTVVITSGHPTCFCAGANIYMLGTSSHGFKVNFCKYTNETRLTLEEASSQSGQHYVAALNGIASGGGYELALACEEILLQDDGNSAVSFPETPLLAVLPGTGGLTRLVDKRMVRRDLADVFSTLAEGVRGDRAKQWRLVDAVYPKSKFDEKVAERASALAAKTPDRPGPGVPLPQIEVERSEGDGRIQLSYTHVSVDIEPDKRVARITVKGPSEPPAIDAATLRERGARNWALAAFRELDHALLDLRFNHAEIGVLLLHTQGDPDRVREHDEALLRLARGDGERDWFAGEVLLHLGRVLKRLDLMAKSVFAIVEPGSCFAGSLFELTLAADRTYMLDGETDAGAARIGLGAMSFGPLPMFNGLTRLQTRFLGEPERLEQLKARQELLSAAAAVELGLVTFAFDDIDWEDDVRVAIEERASLSPDALTGMEANLRFAGPETMATKIFARLSAWQNWIFQRPNAVGERGALTMYGRPERPQFDWRRT